MSGLRGRATRVTIGIEDILDGPRGRAFMMAQGLLDHGGNIVEGQASLEEVLDRDLVGGVQHGGAVPPAARAR